MASDGVFAMAGNWYCTRFAGRDDVHAGDPLMRGSTRKLAIVLQVATDWENTTADPVTTELASCGENDVQLMRIRAQPWEGDAVFLPFMENAVLQMKTSGVTSTLCHRRVGVDRCRGQRRRVVRPVGVPHAGRLDVLDVPAGLRHSDGRPPSDARDVRARITQRAI